LERDEKLAKEVAVAMIRLAKRSPRGLGELLDRVEEKVPQVSAVAVTGLKLLPEILSAARKRAEDADSRSS
jgi:hypothetical protein